MTPRTASRLAWSILAVTAVVVAAVVSLAAANGFETAPGQFGPSTFLALFALVFGSVGALIASRRPENAIGWIFVGTGLAMAVQELGNEWGLRGAHLRADPLPLAELGAWLPTWVWVSVTLGMASYLFLLFPTGRAPSRRWRAAGWVTGAGIVVASFALAFTPGPLENFRTVINPVGLDVDRELMLSLGNAGLGLCLLGTILSVASLVVRWRRSEGEERGQLKWLISAGILLVITFGSAVTVAFTSRDIPPVLVGGIIVSFLAIPVATGIGVLRYRLYDIDVVISRTVVYAILLGIIALDYLAIVVGIGTLVGNRSSPFLTAVAAGVVAMTFQPINRRLRHFANRLVYGKRATPYEVLSEFAERASESYSIDDVLPRMARVLGEGTGAARAEVWLHVGTSMQLAAAWPVDAPAVDLDAEVVVPVVHQGEELGRLAVRKRAGERLTPSEERLLADLASQAGLVMRNARLVEELRASRKRLVAAQDMERRRLERDIHDGAQQHLVSLMVKVRVLESLARKNPDRVADALPDLKAQAGEALENLRDLARGIYLPLLADQGLPAAIEAQSRKTPFEVRFHPDGVGRHPQEVEAAVYFCILEALQNVAKYAEASRVDLTLRQADGGLAFEVRDDGRGFDAAAAPLGTGLVNMRDRLEAIGGSFQVRSAPGEGTVVEGRIPVQAPGAPEVAAAQASSSRSGSNSDLGT